MGFVQSASNTGTGNVTATFGTNTTAANTIIAMISSAAASFTAFTGVTLTGSADTFVKRKASTTNASAIDAEHWSDINCAGGHTAVVAAIGAVNASHIHAIEWNGISAVDKNNIGSNNTGVTSSSSGASGTLTQASEVAFGQVMWDTLGGGTPTVTGPASPWTNLSSISGAAGDVQLASYQQVSATTSLTYTTTSSITAVYQSIIVTYELTASVTIALSPVDTTDTIFGVTLSFIPPPKLVWSIVGALTVNDPLTNVACPQGFTNFEPGVTTFNVNLNAAAIVFNTPGQGSPAQITAIQAGSIAMVTGTTTHSGDAEAGIFISSEWSAGNTGQAGANIEAPPSNTNALFVNTTAMTVP